MKKQCFIIAGPNGAGKTTFAREVLPTEVVCLNFFNADLIAQGLSPFNPHKKAIEAGRIMLQSINDAVEKGLSFSFETTLSGMGYISKIEKWKNLGYEVIIFYLKLPSVDLAIDRVKLRVSQGGHNIPIQDIKRRYHRSSFNFEKYYKPLANSWVVYDTSKGIPKQVDFSEVDKI